MVVVPVFSDLIAATDPNVRLIGNILQEFFECDNTPSAAYDTAMQANGKHFGRVFAVFIPFLIQRVKAVFEILIFLFYLPLN